MGNNNNPVNTVQDSNVWHILIHPNPMLMDKVFKTKQSESYNPQEDEGLLPPCDYYIPFIDISWRPSRSKSSDDELDDKLYDPIMDGSALRSDFHGFLFVYGTDKLIQQIIGSKLNKSLRMSIRRYRDTEGQPIRISSEEMTRFRSAVLRQDFQICQGFPVQEIIQGDRVIAVEGPMKGGVGDVLEIRYDQQGVKLKIAFPMFNDKFLIAIPGFRVNEVRLLNPETTQLLQDPIIANFENELIELLHHRHGAQGSATLSSEDEKRLKFLYHYSGIVFENDEASAAKFTALMLICVYLLKDKKTTERYVQQVTTLLSKGNEDSSSLPSSVTTELDCYLATALFVATHDPNLRTAAKHYRQSHPDCAKSICRLQSIAKRI